MVAEAATEGNKAARAILDRALETFGWAIAQMISLLAPEVVVVGGGVPLLGEALFFTPLRRQVDRYVFPPLVGTFRIAPSQLGEEVVVHGALAVAAAAHSSAFSPILRKQLEVRLGMDAGGTGRRGL